MKNQESHLLGKYFLYVWILASLAAFLVGFPICILFLDAVDHFAPNFASAYLGIGLGAIVGFSQWLVIRKPLSMGSFWGTSYVIGFGVPFSLSSILTQLGVKGVQLDDNNLAFITVFLLGSLLSGLLQSSRLRQHSKKAIHWITITTLSWGIAAGLTFMGPYVVPVPHGPSLYFPSMILFSALLIGVSTGYGLKWILCSEASKHGL
jgi:hypothetical protein